MEGISQVESGVRGSTRYLSSLRERDRRVFGRQFSLNSDLDMPITIFYNSENKEDFVRVLTNLNDKIKNV